MRLIRVCLGPDGGRELSDRRDAPCGGALRLGAAPGNEGALAGATPPLHSRGWRINIAARRGCTPG